MQRQQFTEQQQQITQQQTTQEQRVSRVEQQVTRQVTSQQRGKFMCLVYCEGVDIAEVNVGHRGQLSNSLRPSGHYITICTAILTFSNSTFRPHSVFTCFVWI
jgi:hypothetical protein